MNITLSAPPDIICEVRSWAEENGTSLNDYIRDCLAAKAGEIKAVRLSRAQQFYDFATTNPIQVPRSFHFSREAANGRRMRCAK